MSRRHGWRRERRTARLHAVGKDRHPKLRMVEPSAKQRQVIAWT